MDKEYTTKYTIYSWHFLSGMFDIIPVIHVCQKMNCTNKMLPLCEFHINYVDTTHVQ